MAATKQKYTEHNGEPGCQGLEEVNRMFRNFWDPTSYWVCESQGKRAQLKRCPQSHLYSDRLSTCIHYANWEWTDPKEPPSRPQINQKCEIH